MTQAKLAMRVWVALQLVLVANVAWSALASYPAVSRHCHGMREPPPVSINTADKVFSYTDILKQFGFTPTLYHPWASCGKSKLVQGWKLHLSSIQTEAVPLLRLLLPFLSDAKVSFKVIQSPSLLARLNEGLLGVTQVGKSVTIYPDSDAEARKLAEMLVQITQGFHGPIVMTDLRLGDVVYARYGGFNPVVTRDRLGQRVLSIYTPGGSLRRDTYDVPFVPPHGVSNPFEDFPEVPLPPGDALLSAAHSSPTPRLFGPGYLILEVVKTHPKGSVFRGLDLRYQEEVSIKIIKQGRQYCLSDDYGRDMRSRLRRQQDLHAALTGIVPIPQAGPYFEVNGHGYLPIEFLEGQTLDQVITEHLNHQPWSRLAIADKVRLLEYFANTVFAVEKLHRAGYVHRDVTGSNIFITDEEQTYLIDLELAHAVDDPTPPFGMGTPGFMSPEQEARMPPQFADDVYSLGCLLLLTLTGIDPRRSLSIPEHHRRKQWQQLTEGADERLIAIAALCVSPEPDERPNLKTIASNIRDCIEALPHSVDEVDPATAEPLNSAPFATDLAGSFQELVKSGQLGLLRSVLLDEASGIWLSPAFGNESPNELPDNRSYEIRRSANRGAAGAIYMLGRLARFGYTTFESQQRVQETMPWLLNDKEASDFGMPGLHFGEAGVAVAVAEAIAGRLIPRTPSIDEFLVKALSGVLDWPDITHGAAGQGIAALYCGDRLQDSTLVRLSGRCAEFLIRTQKADGTWEIPPGVDGISGQTLTGFAHGVSGIVYFLAEYARRFGAPEVQKAWQNGTNWLIQQAHPTEDNLALEWDFSDLTADHWKWWCHGSPGIALLFLRLYEQSLNPVYADVARKALRVHPVAIQYPNLSQCHGLSGLGEIYMEAARVLGEAEWKTRALNIARNLIHFRQETPVGSATWLVEDPNFATADLMVGTSGVVHFLLRVSLNGTGIGFPLLLDPL